MSGEYRATDKDWELVEGWARISSQRTPRCLLELRSRVEALEQASLALATTVSSAGHDHQKRIELLEATQHAHLDGSQLSEAERESMTEPGRVVALEKAIRVITGSLTPAEQAELGVVSVKDLQADLRSIAFEAMKAAQEAMTEPGKVVTDQPEPSPDATDEELYRTYVLDTGPTVADGLRAIYDLGRQHGARAPATEADNATAATVAEIRSLLFKDAAQPAPAVKDSLTAAPPPLRCPGAHTIAECGGPCEQDFRLCDCGLLQQLNPAAATEDSSAAAPAVSLVEQILDAMDQHLESNRYAEARAALRVVADWFRNQRDSPETAAALEQESSR
jgi:hypothetical protein